MQATLTQLTYEIKREPGERLRLRSSLVDSIGPGHWLVRITPLSRTAFAEPIRDQTALLNSYAPQDEGLYDDYPAR